MNQQLSIEEVITMLRCEGPAPQWLAHLAANRLAEQLRTLDVVNESLKRIDAGLDDLVEKQKLQLAEAEAKSRTLRVVEEAMKTFLAQAGCADMGEVLERISYLESENCRLRSAWGYTDN